MKCESSKTVKAKTKHCKITVQFSCDVGLNFVNIDRRRITNVYKLILQNKKTKFRQCGVRVLSFLSVIDWINNFSLETENQDAYLPMKTWFAGIERSLHVIIFHDVNKQA